MAKMNTANGEGAITHLTLQLHLWAGLNMPGPSNIICYA